MRVIPIDGKVRQLAGVAAWPGRGNVLAVEVVVGADYDGGGARSVRWLTLLDGAEFRRRDLPTKGGGPNAALSPDLRLLAYVLSDAAGDLVVLEKAEEPASRVVLHISETPEGEEDERLSYLALAIGPGGQSLRVCTTGGGFVGWEIGDAFERKGRAISRLVCSAYVGEDELGFVTDVMAFLPDGDVALGQDAGACWFIGPNGEARGWIAEDKEGKQGAVRGIAVSPDGGALLLGIDDLVEEWTTEGLFQTLTLKGHGGVVTAVAYSPDGKTIATADEAGIVRFWDAESGEMLKSWDWQTGPLRAVAFSPDGFTCVAAAGDEKGSVIVWDLDGD